MPKLGLYDPAWVLMQLFNTSAESSCHFGCKPWGTELLLSSGKIEWKGHPRSAGQNPNLKASSGSKVRCLPPLWILARPMKHAYVVGAIQCFEVGSAACHNIHCTIGFGWSISRMPCVPCVIHNRSSGLIIGARKSCSDSFIRCDVVRWVKAVEFRRNVSIL